MFLVGTDLFKFFIELLKMYSDWVPNFQYEQLIFHKMLIVFIAFVKWPF
jgi:hypothetical protein